MALSLVLSLVLNLEDFAHVELALDLLLWHIHAKPLFTRLSLENNGIQRVLGNVASIDHLAHEISCTSVIVGLLFGPLDSAPKVGKLLQFCLYLLLPDYLSLLLLLDFVFRASSLGGLLQHVCTNTLVHYSWK